MKTPNPTMLFHVGDPRTELPHKSMDRCDKLWREHPDIKLVVVVRSAQAESEIKAHLAGRNAAVWLWEEDADGDIMNLLLENIGDAVGANIITTSWYTCPSGHITPSTGGVLKEKCEEGGCQDAVTHVLAGKDDLKAFAEMFNKVILLSNFDTRSGDWLHAQVSPTANWGRNMRHATSGATTRALRRIGRGKAIALCAAGPSLTHAIPHLKRLQEKILISCVGRSYKLLRKNGIRVDYTITCEMFDWDAAIFDGLTAADVGDTVLLYASVASPRAVEAWPGDKVCLWDVNTAKMLGRDDAIYGGNSVAHHQLNFAAQILECDPIVLVGTDLAYTEGDETKTHADGTFAEGWPADVKAVETQRQAELWVPCTGRGDKFDPENHRVQVWMQGGFKPFGPIEVRSSPSYREFATMFEILIAKHGRKVYNACPNGQKIGGTEYLDLSGWMVDAPVAAEVCAGR